nr:FGGY family carbohydrate kinase [Tessaracoccus coleopterorum]
MAADTDLWLGVDLGTTGVRCVVFDAALSPVSSAYLEAPPRYLPDGTVEQDAESWFDSTVAVMGRAVAGIDASRVGGLSLSTQGISVVPVGRDGRPSGPPSPGWT